MTQPTIQLDETPDTRSPRTPFGAAWRGAAVLVLVGVGMAVSGWLGSKVIRYDSELVTVFTGPLAVAAGGLVAGWLRARNGFLGCTMLGSLVGAQSVSYLLHDDYLSFQRPYLHLTHGLLATYEVSSLALGWGAVLVAVLWGTASGYRRPRPLKDENM
ncbi:hypothetical protein ACFWP7_01855 [Streptomyces sp. NPDC058470]|uniref:hypothetical protein n=1 Tax=Streptomyces sp. NPDC058470 TaxID=3346515 RepID=UPI003646AC3B